ncbi:pyridoxamine 5'-phosphate oxidase family protein [Paracoccus cavernae]|uniref:pyridoxamine 5'-phosphate oxidase family protein n=1 Tax=Paracoccus cavernae TaxID=1571207 RepID=UPI00363C28E7
MNAITPRGLEINTAAARPLDAIRVSRNLLLTTRVASFATLDPGGFPYNTATNLAVEADGTPVFFTAYLALHARNIEADPRTSITLADHDSDVMTKPRLTLSGVLERVTGPDFEALKETYAERFPNRNSISRCPIPCSTVCAPKRCSSMVVRRRMPTRLWRRIWSPTCPAPAS